MLKVFTPAQREELTAHLRKVLPDPLDEVIERLDRQCEVAMLNPSDILRDRACFHKESQAIAAHGEALATLLTNWGMVDDDGNFVGLNDVAPSFHQDLRRIIAIAQVDANAWAPRGNGPGRRANFLRDQLITTTFEIYPPGEATKREDSHFERTVRLLLRYIDQEIEDVHSLVIDALRRQRPTGVVIIERK